MPEYTTQIKSSTELGMHNFMSEEILTSWIIWLNSFVGPGKSNFHIKIIVFLMKYSHLEGTLKNDHPKRIPCAAKLLSISNYFGRGQRMGADL